MCTVLCLMLSKRKVNKGLDYMSMNKKLPHNIFVFENHGFLHSHRQTVIDQLSGRYILSIQAQEQVRHIRKNQKSVRRCTHQYLGMFGYIRSHNIHTCMYRRMCLDKHECNYQAMAEARKNMAEEAEDQEAEAEVAEEQEEQPELQN